MRRDVTCIFLPGFGARATAYVEGLPAGWEALQPPPVSSTGGSLDALGRWLTDELLRRPGPVILGGHSMGAALAVVVASRSPELVAGLVLVSPAGLPLTKPIHQSARDLARQVVRGRHRVADVATSAREMLAAPIATRRLIRTLRVLSLEREMERVRNAGIPASVIGCATDTLTTPAHCAATARLLGGGYRELGTSGGHVWMFGRWRLFERELSIAAAR
jgi:pyochelin biosynthesis protein PchC